MNQMNAAIPSPVQIRTIKPGFAVEISGVDLRTASADIQDEIVALYKQHSAMVIRGQNLTPAELLAFSAKIGPIVAQSREEQTHPDYPAISVLSNKVENGKLIGVHWNGLGWHTDGTYLPKPLISTILYGVETPPEGGDTLVADTCAAFYALPPERQAFLEGLEVLHSFSYLADKQALKGRVPATEEQKATFPDRTHPLVMTHAQNGRKSFYLTGGTTKAIVGMEDEEKGRQLVGELIKFVTQEEFVYRHKWRQGDILIWNDLYTMHTATLYDDKAYDRLMYRVWLD